MENDNIAFMERLNALTSKTNNEEFEKNGCLLIKNLWDPTELICDVPQYRGMMTYMGKLNKFKYDPIEQQVHGSLARYYYPPYKFVHSQVRKKIEKVIGKELFNTYYYDRFYFPGQDLKRHVDRDACEISVTLHISTNLKKKWPIFVKSPDEYNNEEKEEIIKYGKNLSFSLNPGDGIIYKGCERPHWRDAMPSNYSKVEQMYRKFKNLEDDTYYHQVFFHYVLADGNRLQYAGDRK